MWMFCFLDHKEMIAEVYTPAPPKAQCPSVDGGNLARPWTPVALQFSFLRIYRNVKTLSSTTLNPKQLLQRPPRLLRAVRSGSKLQTAMRRLLSSTRPATHCPLAGSGGLEVRVLGFRVYDFRVYSPLK